MTDHPSPSVLARFVKGTASPAEARSVVSHLLRGCDRCRAGISPGAQAVLTDWKAEPETAGVAAAAEAEYELPIKRAVDSLLRHGADAAKIKAATRKFHQALVTKGLDRVRLWNVPDAAILNALLQRVHELRHDDPGEMLRCAACAVQTAKRMTDGAPDQQADVMARTLGEYANAFRVAGNLPFAEEKLELAEEWAMTGTQDVVLELRLRDLRASLYGSQQRYADAISLLDEVIQRRLELGDWPGAAKALIGRGTFTGYAGRLQEAFAFFDEALALIDSDSEPELVAIARQNCLDFKVDAGQYAEALEILKVHREELGAPAGRVNQLKLLGIEGRILGGLGILGQAEDRLREARAGFQEVRENQCVALATLDLATVVLRQSRGRYSEAVSLAVEALQVFTNLHIKPQVMEALSVLAHAVQERLVTATLLQSVTDFMHKAEHDRQARYQPRFE